MSEFKQIISKVSYESSLLFLSLLIAGLIALKLAPNSVIGACLLAIAAFVGVLGFMVNSIRESYHDVISQKDSMIQTLTDDRKNEIKHSQQMWKQVNQTLDKGWKSDRPNNSDSTNI